MPVLQNRYELGSTLGSGGMAEVVEGYDRVLERPVAVKFLRTDACDPRARERFEREARVAARFTHPHAVAVFDVGEDGSRPYIVMEKVEGQTLADLLRERSSLDPEEATAITDQVLAALSAAHERGLVHRDVKPANVLVGRDGTAKLADFGIAKALADATALTASGQMVGTPRYLSPEQAAGEPAGPRSDLYAVGVMLYEMLAGQPPFRGDAPIAVALAHRQSPVPPLTEIRQDLPPALAYTVERALEKDPARRFPSAAAMRAELAGRGVATTRAAPVVPTETMPRARRRPAARRQRRGRWWAATLLVLLVAGGVAAVALLARDNGGRSPSPVSNPAAPAPASAVPSTDRAPSTTRAPVTAAAPATIDALIARLSTNPSAAGEKGLDLLKRLEELQASNGNDQAARAAQLTREIERWVGRGRLDPATGSLATRLLAPLASHAGEKGHGEEGGD